MDKDGRHEDRRINIFIKIGRGIVSSADLCYNEVEDTQPNKCCRDEKDIAMKQKTTENPTKKKIIVTSIIFTIIFLIIIFVAVVISNV